MTTNSDPQFEQFCSFNALNIQLRYIAEYYQANPEAEDFQNLRPAIMTAQHAIGYCIKLLAEQIFEPQIPENNG